MLFQNSGMSPCALKPQFYIPTPFPGWGLSVTAATHCSTSPHADSWAEVTSLPSSSFLFSRLSSEMLTPRPSSPLELAFFNDARKGIEM